MPFVFTKKHLQEILPNTTYLDEWYSALSKLLPEYDISTPERVAAFMAQCAHESGGFKSLKENLNYKAESLCKVFPRYFPNIELAKQYAHQQEKITILHSQKVLKLL